MLTHGQTDVHYQYKTQNGLIGHPDTNPWSVDCKTNDSSAHTYRDIHN